MSFIRLLPLAILIFMFQTAYMQGIKGRLTDVKNNPIPFAAVYDESTYAGTTSNAEGFYELKLASGKHSIIYKSLGYFIERRTVETSTSTITINIQLSEQAYELKDVIVTPGKEDPAFAIMRKVIGKAPYHLNQVKEYSSDVYIRGSIHIIHIPKFIAKKIEVNGKKGLIKDGDTYMVESINQIDFKAPDKYNQKVKSFQTNFPGENDVSPMQIISSSFYNPKIDEAVSPLAPNAFSYYKYRYEGYSREGDYTIFKIKVIPKRKSQLLLSGYIFIIDQLWCLHSVDVTQEMFYGQLNYKEIFSPVKENAWLPISYRFRVNAAIMGIKADFNYTSSVKYQKVVLNEKNIIKPVKIADAKEELVKPVKNVSPKKLKNQQEIERLMTKDDLNNREMVKLAGLMAKEAPLDTAKSKSLEIKDNNTNVSIEKDAMKKDTAYWNTVRPIPLTSVESGLSHSVDSVKTINKDTVAKKDTASSKSKKVLGKFSKFITGGAGFYIFDSTTRVQYNGLAGLNKIDFNTVDGFIYKQSFDINVKIDSLHRLKINPGVAYAFSRKTWMGWVNANINYSPLKNGNFSIDYHKGTTDYNQNEGMNNLLNAATSLFFRRNYKKFYEESCINIKNSIDIANGLKLTGSMGFSSEKVLQNNSNYSFFYRNTREYTSNEPVNKAEDIILNRDNKEAYLKLALEYTPEYFYKIRNGQKHYEHSKYPTFFASYIKAIPGIFNSNTNFDFLEIGAKQVKEWGMMHSFSWNIKTGKYLSQKKIYLSDYKFFNNQPLPVIFGNTRNSFFLPDLYENTTNKGFVESHITFSTPYLLLKYLPFISNKIWLENIHLNYLYTKPLGHYWEAGYSISQIYAIGGIGIYSGFKGSTFQAAGVRVTLNFN